jgi:hypothetical protein
VERLGEQGQAIYLAIRHEIISHNTAQLLGGAAAVAVLVFIPFALFMLAGIWRELRLLRRMSP